MRAKGGNATLGELVGSGSSNTMSLKDLDDILGEKKSEMPYNKIGKHRLRRALQQRFGNDYRNIPGVKNIIKEFDDEIASKAVIDRMKAIKPKITIV